VQILILWLRTTYKYFFMPTILILNILTIPALSIFHMYVPYIKIMYGNSNWIQFIFFTLFKNLYYSCFGLIKKWKLYVCIDIIPYLKTFKDLIYLSKLINGKSEAEEIFLWLSMTSKMGKMDMDVARHACHACPVWGSPREED